MRFVTAKTETNVADLTRSLFAIRGAHAAERAQKAEAVLREANPHLRDLAKVPAGTLLVVPDVPGVSSTAAQSVSPVSPEVASQLKQALARAKEVLDRSVAGETGEAEETAALLKKRELKDIVRHAPDVKDRLVQIADQAKARLKAIQTIKAAQTEGLAQLEKDLEEFIKCFS